MQYATTTLSLGAATTAMLHDYTQDDKFDPASDTPAILTISNGGTFGVTLILDSDMTDDERLDLVQRLHAATGKMLTAVQAADLKAGPR